ncbi:MAG: N-glycosylase/DNA lyase [Ignisphaera sp.]
MLGIERVSIFEDIDPQYQVVKYALENCDERLTSYAFYINALLAYRLRISGEEFWSNFAEYLTRNCKSIENFYQVVDLVGNFTSRFNNYAYYQKIKRLNKLRYCMDVNDVIDRGDIQELAKRTAECLNSSVESKTVVFSVKMVYYVHKARGKRIILPFELPIPVDKRVAFVTYTSGLIESNANDVVSLLFRKPNVVRKVWLMVSLKSNIPSLNIDAVIWYFGKFSQYRDAGKVLKLIDSTLYEILGKNVIEALVNELFYVFT